MSLGLTPLIETPHCLIIKIRKKKYPGHTSGNAAIFHPVI